jgi:hypothetical protein
MHTDTFVAAPPGFPGALLGFGARPRRGFRGPVGTGRSTPMTDERRSDQMAMPGDPWPGEVVPPDETTR